MFLEEKGYSKLKWTSQEESILRQLKQQSGVQSWKKIAHSINEKFKSKNRTGKQCRERYMNYIRFNEQTPKVCNWEPEEDQMLFLKFMQYGAKWVQISKDMPGRSENCLKNRFYGALRKIARKIAKVTRQKKLKIKKAIKAEYFIRALLFSNSSMSDTSALAQEKNQFIENLKRLIIKIAVNREQDQNDQQIQELINKILEFCALTKAMSNRKNFQKDYNNNIVDNSEENNSKKHAQVFSIFQEPMVIEYFRYRAGSEHTGQPVQIPQETGATPKQVPVYILQRQDGGQNNQGVASLHAVNPGYDQSALQIVYKLVIGI